MLLLNGVACGMRVGALRLALGLAAVLAPFAALAQDVFGAGPVRRQPQALETARLCGRADPGPYVIRNPPSCARSIAEGEQRYGVRAAFVTLRESREIPASWMFASPTGPCAEGESLVFFTDAGRQLFAQTAGQCGDRFAASPPGPSGRPQPRPDAGPVPGPAPSPRSASDPSPNPPLPQSPGGFACIDPRPGGRLEQVRGLPGGALCQLRANDELWCRQRNALSYDPYLPTNAAWPMQPVGVRVLRDCSIVRSEPRPQPPVTADRVPEGDYWKGVEAGFQNCGQSVAVLVEAMRFMSQGNFPGAARLLGATDSASGLRALWIEWMQTPVISLTGAPPTEYERGKRQAERVCMYVLLPKAQSCVARGAGCMIRAGGSAAARSCAAFMNRVGELREKLPTFRGKPPPSPIFRGLLLVDEQYIKQLAATENKIILLRDSNQWSMRWIGREGYAPKPQDVKGKTLKPEDVANLPAADRDRYLGLASAKGMRLEERTELLQKGYRIASPGAQEIITGPKGERFYSDNDLHGVYNLDGTSGWSDALLQKLQCHFFERGVQHGPHDAWALRNDKAKAGPNFGPQVGDGKAVTAYFPDGRVYHITTLREMKALYASFGANWQAIYPYH